MIMVIVVFFDGGIFMFKPASVINCCSNFQKGEKQKLTKAIAILKKWRKKVVVLARIPLTSFMRITMIMNERSERLSNRKFVLS